MKNKVYIIEPEIAIGEGIHPAVHKNLSLRAEIFAMAVTEKDGVYFHRHVDNSAGGAPCLMLECSPEFLERVKRLPLFGDSREYNGAPTFRAGHAGPIDPSDLNRVLAQPEKDPSVFAATWRLQDEILDLAIERGMAGKVLIRHVDGDRGFISLMCPEALVEDIKALPRCRAIVTPKQAGKIMHHRHKGP